MSKLSLPVLQANFPRMGKYRSVWKEQEQSMAFVAENGSALVESPTGSGKTAIQYAITQAAQNEGRKPVFLIVPNKTILEQTANEFPGAFKIALGRNEHPCLYYHDDKEELTPSFVRDLYADPEAIRADEIPCSFLRDCPHRVDQATGETFEPGAAPCPYYQQKFEAKQGGVVLSTMSFYLFTQLFSREWDTPEVLVIDEVHQLAEVFRNALSYEITDWHLGKAVELLKRIDSTSTKKVDEFRKKLIHTAKKKPAHQPTLLEDVELRKFIDLLEGIDNKELEREIRGAINEGKIDVAEDRVTLKKLETFVRDLRRYLHSFEYSLEAPPDRHALNYTYAFYKEERDENERVQYKLVVQSHYVAGLIRKVLSPQTVSFSATIGDPDIFSYESGIKSPFLALESGFPVENCRIFMPKDSPNLAWNAQKQGTLAKVLRRVAKTCKRFADKGIRSLIVTVSNAERDEFVLIANDEGLIPISYGSNGVTAKTAALMFKNGQGDVLVGTEAVYSQGIDLPGGIAPVIFVLRPGYPQPKAPATVFEERRFGSARWKIVNWRVIQRALQTRGRNIRGLRDKGVTFFVSEQFRRFVYGSLPKWLEKSYRGDKTWDQCVKETEELLG
ncbi:MAG: DEAD/DEAH box helicase [Patescibacteria group bacterium]